MYSVGSPSQQQQQQQQQQKQQQQHNNEWKVAVTMPYMEVVELYMDHTQGPHTNQFGLILTYFGLKIGL